MNNDEVTKNIWRNSISNYVCLGLRIVVGLFVFRTLYQYFSKEEFGFWALLWSLFGYGILLDFGFGFTAMKRAAELSVEGNWDELSRVLSTVFYLYVVLSFILVCVICLGSGYLIRWFQITPGNENLFRQILIIFFCGMGIGFPFGIFTEVLVGLQRICLVNVIFSLSFIGNAVLVLLGVYERWGMEYFMAIGLLSGIVPSVLCAVFTARALPQVKINPRLFSWSMVRKTTTFSIFAYVITVSTMLLGKTNQLVLSTALAVAAVAIYQAGAKIAEMFGAFTQQLPDTFSPAAAHLNAKGDKAFLRKLLINGTRFSVMLATPVYFISAFYMEGLLRLLTGDKVIDNETYWVGQILLLWCYMGLVTQTVPRRIFMVCGHEKRLTWLTVGEATLNLVLTIGFVLYFKNVPSVAVGSLIATTFFGWFFIWPWAAREANLSGLELARVVLTPTVVACLPLLVFVLISRFGPWFDGRTNLLAFLVQCAVASLVALAGLWRLALTVDERAAIALKFAKLIQRKAAV